MALSEEKRDRLSDIVELQPTKNSELQERWGIESGSDLHRYLEDHLSEYYYRNENSLICATPAGEALVNGEAVTEQVVSGSPLHERVLAALPGPDETPQSVVATLQSVRDQHGDDEDPDVDEVRSALHDLVDRGVVERVRKTVPTFRLAVERESITVETDE
jgi:hypothetical protein